MIPASSLTYGLVIAFLVGLVFGATLVFGMGMLKLLRLEDWWFQDWQPNHPTWVNVIVLFAAGLPATSGWWAIIHLIAWDK